MWESLSKSEWESVKETHFFLFCPLQRRSLLCTSEKLLPEVCFKYVEKNPVKEASSLSRVPEVQNSKDVFFK